MRLILFATLREARPTLELFKAKKLTDTVYEYAVGKIIISGMGILATTAALAQHLVGATEIINAGLAGALDNSLELGSVAVIGTVMLHLQALKTLDLHSQLLATSCYPCIELGTGPTLITSLVPVHDAKLKDEMRQKGILVDMEGYAAAYLARHAQIPCTLIKVVSDFSKCEDIPLLQQNIDQLAETLAQALPQLR